VLRFNRGERRANIQHTTYNIQHTTYNIQHTTYNIIYFAKAFFNKKVNLFSEFRKQVFDFYNNIKLKRGKK